MTKIEQKIKDLVNQYVEKGNEKDLDEAEKLFNDNSKTITTSWEDLCGGWL